MSYNENDHYGEIFDQERCDCVHEPDDHDIDGCEMLGCWCEATWWAES
jgi:hypothetical protein